MTTSKSTSEETSFIVHLLEIRSRLLKCLFVVLVIFLGLFWFANDIYMFVSEPLRASFLADGKMIATEVTSTFLAPFKLTLICSFFISIPYILNQVWAFIAPALYQNEKKTVVPLLLLSVILFYLGVAFAYFVAFPLIFSFFAQTAPETVTVMTDITNFLNFILKLFFAFGLAFQIPVATVMLVWSGSSSIESLIKKRPYIIIACFVIGMLLTPPDVFSQSLLAIPMWLLFEIGLIFARLKYKTDSNC